MLRIDSVGMQIKKYLPHFQLVLCWMHRLPTPVWCWRQVTQEQAADWVTAVAVSSQVSLHAFANTYSPCTCEADPNDPKGTETMSHANDQDSRTPAIFLSLAACSQFSSYTKACYGSTQFPTSVH